MKDSRGSDHAGHGTELMFDSIAVCCGANTILYSLLIFTGNNVRYSYNCNTSDNIFGCVGLRRKQYCILNKQYSKSDYDTLVPKIIEHMKTTAEWGHFSPATLSPFCYNETVAQEYFPLTKSEALAQGYRWKDPETRNYAVTKTWSVLPETIAEAGDAILQDTISCQHQGTCNENCATAFKITPQELQFYQRMNLPLPRLCSSCRHYQRFRKRNPLKLWHRTCMCEQTHPHHTGACPNEFETSYALDRPEIVYCEPCYQAEVA